MRLGFLGSPAFAVPALHALIAAGHEIAVVYCQPAKPAHRGQAITRCAVHAAGAALGIEIRTPARLRGEAAEHAVFAGLNLDAAVVAAYGLILPAAMLAAPRLGCLNIHASLLPRWRGAAPIQAALRAGDAQTGIAIMQMEAGLDTGAVRARQAIPIGPRDTTPILHDALAALGARLIVATLADLPPAVPQPAEGVTYAAKLTRADAALDFTQPAIVLDRQIRALTPWPGTTATLAGDPLKVLQATPVDAEGTDGRAIQDQAIQNPGAPGDILDAAFTVACGSGALRLDRVQRPGRPPTDGAAFLRGLPDWRDLRLS